MNTSFERTEQKDEWLTPKFVLDAIGPFDLDPCAPIIRPWPMAETHYTIEDNGLLKPWFGFVFCNPPYGNQTIKWMKRMAEDVSGIALTFARTDTKMFQDVIFKTASALLFLRKRLMFCDTSGKPKLNKKGKPQGAGSPSVLIGYGEEATKRLENCCLDGFRIRLFGKEKE